MEHPQQRLVKSSRAWHKKLKTTSDAVRYETLEEQLYVDGMQMTAW